MDSLFKSIYYSPNLPGSYGGVDGLYKRAKRLHPNVTRVQVVKWLQAQPTYSLHKPVSYRFARQRTRVPGMNIQVQIDLVDMQTLSKSNDGYKYLLTCIDVFSKVARVVPIKRKTDTTEAFETILDDIHVLVVQSDAGTEFTNRRFQKLLADRAIHHFITHSETKSAIVERFHRTLKNKMFRYFSHRQSYRWLDVLPLLVESYNNTYHSSIKMAPAKVAENNQHKVWHALYGRSQVKRKYKFRLGDTVKISRTRMLFRRGYQAHWTEEYFVVTHRVRNDPPTYRLKDLHDEPIQGIFYEEELQKIIPEKRFRIEKILKRRGNRVFVKWVGYPDTFNSWVDSTAVGAI